MSICSNPYTLYINTMRFPLALVPSNTKIDFIGKRFIAFAASILVTIATIIGLYTHGLNLGIDFTGGIIVEARAQNEVDISILRDHLSENGYFGASIQHFGSANDIMIRVQPKHSDSQAKEATEIKMLAASILGSDVEFRRVDYVGPKVGSELVLKGILALLATLVGIMIYVWFRFSVQFGIGAVVALLHDALATLGFYIVTGYEFDLTSIAALLTIIGFSINDTVVIYDRIRENLRKHKSDEFSSIINLSVNETLSRTIMTVSTTVLGSLALVLFGGEVIRGFSMAMMFGFIFGTYSSVYISAPILMYTQFKNSQKHLALA